MKKIFILSLLVIFALSFTSFANAATKARTASVAQGLQGVYGVADLSSGDSLEVDSTGSAYVRPLPVSTVVSSTGITLNSGTALITGEANIESITVSGFGTAAGDYVLLYDALSATGTPKWEATAGTAKGTYTIDTKGAAVTTGLFADSNADQIHVSVSYN